MNTPSAASTSLFPSAYLERRASYRAFMTQHVYSTPAPTTSPTAA